jgi:hypothetical protein
MFHRRHFILGLRQALSKHHTPQLAPCFVSSIHDSNEPSLQPPQHHAHCLIYRSFLAASSSSIILLKGPFLTIKLITSYRASAAAIVVSSALVSYAGATSTISAAMRLIPSNPLKIVRSSRVDQPPVSGVPVAGATEIC